MNVLHHSNRLIKVVTIAGLVALSVWAFKPLHIHTPVLPASITEPLVTASAPSLQINLAAFNTPVWPTPPPVVVAPPPAPVVVLPPPAPLRWQLLAIVQEHSSLKAMIYDPDADEVVTLAQDDRVGARTITRITPFTIEVKDTQGNTTLSLHDAQRRPMP